MHVTPEDGWALALVGVTKTRPVMKFAVCGGAALPHRHLYPPRGPCSLGAEEEEPHRERGYGGERGQREEAAKKEDP